jgi:hypothetical protein
MQKYFKSTSRQLPNKKWTPEYYITEQEGATINEEKGISEITTLIPKKKQMNLSATILLKRDIY